MNEKKIKCVACGAFLGDRNAPHEALSYVNIMSKNWLVPVPLCSTCGIDSGLIDKVRRDYLKLAGITPKDDEVFSFEEGRKFLRDIVRDGSEGLCYDCSEAVADSDECIVGWRLYHKKCRGITEVA